MIGVETQRRAWRPGGRRPGHPRHRTVGHHRRPATASTPPGAMAASRGDRAQAHRRRAGHLTCPGGHAGLLGFTSEARWLRHADRHLRHLFPYLPGQSGYNKRLRRTAGLLRHVIRAVACDTALWSDDVWVVDSTPVECGRSRDTANLDSREAGCARLLCCLGPGPCVKTLVARGADAFGTENINSSTRTRWVEIAKR